MKLQYDLSKFQYLRKLYTLQEILETSALPYTVKVNTT